MEDASADRFQRVLTQTVGGRLRVVRGQNLLYRIPVEPDLTIPVDPAHPSRGDNAFQTDLMIVENRGGLMLPRVVFEMKPGITSHDVLVYAAKARQHKHVYPWLRYGLVAMRKATVPGRALTHREGLDFILAPQGLKGAALQSMVRRLVLAEVRASRQLRIHVRRQGHRRGD